MEKHITINNITEILKQKFPFIYIVDYWDADLCAIGIKAGKKLVYISTLDMVRGKETRLFYEYSFEIEPTDDPDDIISISDLKKADIQTMLTDIKVFFDTVYTV